MNLAGENVDVQHVQHEESSSHEDDLAEPEIVDAALREAEFDASGDRGDEARLWSTVGDVCFLPGQTMHEEDEDDEDPEDDEGDGIDVTQESDVYTAMENLPDDFFTRVPKDGPEVEKRLDELKFAGVLHLAGSVAFDLAGTHPELTDCENTNTQGHHLPWWITAYPQKGYFPPSEALVRECNELEEFFTIYNGMGVRGKTDTLKNMATAAKEQFAAVQEHIAKSYLAVRLRYRLRYINTNKSWLTWKKKGKRRKSSKTKKRSLEENSEDPTGRVARRKRSELH